MDLSQLRTKPEKFGLFTFNTTDCQSPTISPPQDLNFGECPERMDNMAMMMMVQAPPWSYYLTQGRLPMMGVQTPPRPHYLAEVGSDASERKALVASQ